MTTPTLDPPTERNLTTGQKAVLIIATLPMIAAGIAGAVGTYTNIKTVFPNSATALGVVAAGEGATLVLALVMVGLTLLGQASPAMVRLGLWLLPAIASGTGAWVATTGKEAVVYAVTPMAMCVSAEGIGLLARRIVIYRTGVDMEAQRRNAAVMQRLAVQRARSTGHPEKKARTNAEKASWKLMAKVGRGDDQLGADLVTTQRQQLTAGAGTALASMLGTAAVTPVTALPPAPVTNALPSGAPATKAATETVTEPAHHTPAVTQVNPHENEEPPHTRDNNRDTDTAADTDTVTAPGTVTLDQIAAVAGVPTPTPGERLTDTQLDVVLRHLRYAQDPPRSYRQAVAIFRDAGYVGSEARVRKAWGQLMSEEETDAPKETDPTDTDDEDAAADSRP